MQKQVQQSFASSLEHLRTTTLDSYVLHGPSADEGLSPKDLDAWSAMEQLHAEGRVGALGVSNVARAQLELLLDRAKLKPAWVQNRCYANRGWDRQVRDVCRANGIGYQPFSLLTANRKEVASPEVLAIAKRNGMTPAQTIFRFAMDLGMSPLTGTTSEAHMKEDLVVFPPLSAADVAAIESLKV